MQKKTKALLLVSLMLITIQCLASDQDIQPLTSHPAPYAYEGWSPGMQAYSFRKFTFFEAVDKTASLGLHCMEIYPGQKISKEHADARTNHNLSAKLREELKQKLNDAQIKLINYGVVGLPNDEAKCRKIFDFAKDMGIETIVSEPPEDAFDLIERLCEEYKINVAIHNHPKESHYWNPETVLKVCKGRSKRIGACADTGHWVRSGLDPVECIRKLQGRIISLHFKELDDGHDVVWGTHKNRMEPILKELHRQGFKGTFSVEYEYNWENSVPEIRQSIANFNKVAYKLKPGGWEDLLDPELKSWILKPGSWAVENGELALKGGGYIWTKERFGDFILDLEFKVSEKGNSGIFFRTFDLKDVVHTGIEVQIHDTTDGRNYGMCGAIYNCMPPKKNVMRRGRWNRMTLMAKDNMIYIVMNGEQIIEMDIDKWTEARKNPDGTKNKFKHAYKDMAREGHIGFQDHGRAVWYRNIKIKPL
ncbi:MAG: family 16 glycoside hydrolase [Planctomycetota bacterium]|jgi:sugar phosphate isomerase/epimerase